MYGRWAGYEDANPASKPRGRASRTLAVSGHQPDADHGAWSGGRGNPHAYPPICTAAGISVSIRLGAQIGVICSCPRMPRKIRGHKASRAKMATVFARVCRIFELRSAPDSRSTGHQLGLPYLANTACWTSTRMIIGPPVEPAGQGHLAFCGPAANGGEFGPRPLGEGLRYQPFAHVLTPVSLWPVAARSRRARRRLPRSAPPGRGRAGPAGCGYPSW